MEVTPTIPLGFGSQIARFISRFPSQPPIPIAGFTIAAESIRTMMHFGHARRLAGGVALTLAGSLLETMTWTTRALAQPAVRTGEVSLDSLLNTRISTASKYLQTSAEAAASITIVSAEEIRQQGYSTLLEILESVPGMYVGNDRNYPSLGTRGFGRPSDYNNRILMLVDGHAMNEQVWGGAPVGADLPLNLDAIERVEVVRGPGSALYGSSAMFAVINIVMKDGKQTQGSTLRARVGSGAQRQVAGVSAYPVGRLGELTVSALLSRSSGKTLHYPEFSSTANPLGTVQKLDWENTSSVLATLTSENFTTHIGYRSRSKGVPTGSFGQIFADRRAFTNDGSVWLDVNARADFRSRLHASGRVYGDRITYRGAFPMDVDAAALRDRSNTSDAGAEGMLIWDVTSRNRLTLGSEVRRIFRADYFAFDESGAASGDDSPFTLGAIYAQNELQLMRGASIVVGARLDKKVDRLTAATPRIALVLTPAKSTTVKFLYGEAYRAPTVAESDLETNFYDLNPMLRPERVATYEIVAERRLSETVLLGASVYDFGIRNLIDQVDSDTLNGIRYLNVAEVRGRGLELTLNVQPSTVPVALRAWYGLQQTRDKTTDVQLSNSPKNTAHVSFMTRNAWPMHAALTVRHESARKTLNDSWTNAFTRTDATVGYTVSKSRHTWLNGSDLSLRASNLFNTPYSVPAALEHVQNSLPQDARMFSLQFRREF